MADDIQFPNYAPSDIQETSMKKQYITDLGNGMQQSRAKFTRPRKKFSLSYTAVSRQVYDEVDSFFQLNQGMIFKWWNPLRRKMYNTRFTIEEIPCTMSMNSCDFTLELTEV